MCNVFLLYQKSFDKFTLTRMFLWPNHWQIDLKVSVLVTEIARAFFIYLNAKRLFTNGSLNTLQVLFVLGFQVYNFAFYWQNGFYILTNI